MSAFSAEEMNEFFGEFVILPENLPKEEEIIMKGKELEGYLKCLHPAKGRSLLKKVFAEDTYIAFDPEEAEGLHMSWWNDNKTKEEIGDFMLNPANQRVDGKKWNNGICGSRWADFNLNGLAVRFCFYSKKYDKKHFIDCPLLEKKYLIICCLLKTLNERKSTDICRFMEEQIKEERKDKIKRTKPHRLCGICGEVSKQRCGGCNQGYCCVEHQRQDWKEHKKTHTHASP